MNTASTLAAATQASINPPTPADQNTPASAAALSSDFETFLRMLTVQLKNQDPLNPVDASDYAVQLATFSGVEQQVKTNNLLSALGDQMQLLGLSQFAGWVGMEARHQGPARFQGAPISLDVKVSPGSDDAYLIVRDGTDTVVDRIQIPPQDGPLIWGGSDASGNALPYGDYHFFVESFTNQLSGGVQPVEVYSPIVEAKTQGSAAILGLLGGGEIAPSDVTGIRWPQTPGTG